MAPIANLTVKLSAQIAEFQSEFREASRTAEKFQHDFLGTATKASAFGNIIADGVGRALSAFENLAKRAFETASRVKDLSTQLGISTDAVQGFKQAAELAGSSMDAVGIAINKMNQNLAGGDRATVQALRDAGLEFRNIRNMKPEDAFLAITDAIKDIPDPMTQADVAMQVFGKSAAQLLPAIKEGFRETAEAASKMSQDTIERLEKAGDAWQSLSNRVTIWTGEIIAGVHKMFSQPPGEDVYFQKWMDALHLNTKEAKEQLLDLGRVLDTLRGKMEKLSMPKALTKPSPAGVGLPNLSIDELLKIGDALDAEREQHNKATEAAGRHVRELSRVVTEVKAFGVAVDGDMIPQVRRLGVEIPIATGHLTAFADAVAKVQGLAKNGIIPEGPATLGVNVGIPQIPVFAEAGTRSGGSFGDAFKAAASNAFSNMGYALSAAISGATSVKDAISGFAKNVAKDFVGTALSFIPGIGPVLSSLAGPIVDAFSNLFDRNKGRDVVTKFAEGFAGGFDGLHKQLLELGDEGERLWIKLTQGVGRNNPTQAKAAVEEVTAALEAQKNKTKEVAAAAAASSAAQQTALDAISAKYKVTIDKLDSEFKSLSDAVAQEAEEEFMGIVETQQRARMQQIQDEKTAQETMRDNELAEKKASFDEILDLGKKTFDELREIFGRGLDIPARFSSPGGGGTVPALASGGIVRRRTLALVGESGPEAVIPLSQMGRFGRSNQPLDVKVYLPDNTLVLRQFVKGMESEGLA